MQWVAHYTNSNRTYSKLKTLSENQQNRLLEANTRKPTDILFIQCAAISTKEDFDCSVHGIHLDLCYKSFTKILCPSNKHKLQDTLPKSVQKTKEQKRSPSTADLFPTTCFKCNVGWRNKKVKIEVAHKLTLQSAPLKLKLAAIKSNNEPLIICKGPSTPCGERKKDSWWLLYWVCSLLARKTKRPKFIFNFDAIKKFINDNILHCNNVVSMVKFHSLYKTSVDNVSARVYTSKLKDQITSKFRN